MDFFVTPDYIINLHQIAYVERQGGQPQVVLVYFSAVAASGAEQPLPLSITLRGADADLLIQRLTRQPNEDPELRWS